MMLRLRSVLNFFVIQYVLLLLLTVSCATKRDLVDFRQEMNEQNIRTEYLLSALDESIAKLDSLIREQYKFSQSLRALMGSQALEQNDNISLITARQDDINHQLRELSQKLQAIQLYGGFDVKESIGTSQSQNTTDSTVQTSSTPSLLSSSQEDSSGTNPRELYNIALADIKNENYPLAESLFLSFLMQFPEHEFASNAQYWLGEAAYGQKKFNLAIIEFEKVIKKYPKSEKVPAALLKIGFAQIELGKKDAGNKTLKNLIKSYPNSNEAELAKEKLNAP